MPWRLKSSANGLFVQGLIQASKKRTHRSSALLALWEGNPPVTGGFPSQRASYVILTSSCMRELRTPVGDLFAADGTLIGHEAIDLLSTCSLGLLFLPSLLGSVSLHVFPFMHAHERWRHRLSTLGTGHQLLVEAIDLGMSEWETVWVKWVTGLTSWNIMRT